MRDRCPRQDLKIRDLIQLPRPQRDSKTVHCCRRAKAERALRRRSYRGGCSCQGMDGPRRFKNGQSKPGDLVAGKTEEKPGVMQGEANGLHHLHQPGGAHQTGPDSTKGGYFPAVNRALIARCASTRASFAAHRRRSPVGPVAAFELPVQPDLMRTRLLSSNARCCWTFHAAVPSNPIVQGCRKTNCSRFGRPALRLPLSFVRCRVFIAAR